MPVEIAQFEVGLMQNFNELVCDVATKTCAVVDPAYEVDRLLREAEKRGWRITTVLVTHTHHDHIDGLGEMVKATKATAYVGRGELERARQNAGPDANLVPLDGGETIELGETRIGVIPTPGHTPAGRSFLIDGNVITGDTLFIGGCGRADFPGSDSRLLYKSLRRLAELPEETRVYPGHDYGQTVTSTIGWEVTTNPYLLCKTEDEFVALRMGEKPHRPTRGAR